MSTWVALAAGDSATVTFDVTMTATGSRQLEVGNQSETVTVEDPVSESAADVYLRDDNSVSTEEVLDAITKYNSGSELPGHGALSTTDIMEIIVAFNT